jgi:hypothetical protein
MSLRHIVLFRFYDVIDEDTRAEAIGAIQGLSVLPGILEWRLDASIDVRKGPVIAQNVLFEDQAAFEAYRDSAEHKAVGVTLSAVADWLIADYVE